MQIFIGVFFILIGVVFAIYRFKKNSATVLEIKYTQTTSIADAKDIVENMLSSDPNYHHYVELKGVLNTDEVVVAPFCGRQVAYYENKCYSVTEETKVTHDSNGNARTRVQKSERELSSEKSSTPMYIKDQSCNTPVYVDIGSFGPDATIQVGCDRFENNNSQWMSSHSHMFSSHGAHCGGSRFLGYRLKENILNVNQPLYILGELYMNGDSLYIGRSMVSKKPYKLSFMSEDQLISDIKKGNLVAFVFGSIMLLIGVIIIVTI